MHGECLRNLLVLVQKPCLVTPLRKALGPHRLPASRPLTLKLSERNVKPGTISSCTSCTKTIGDWARSWSAMDRQRQGLDSDSKIFLPTSEFLNTTFPNSSLSLKFSNSRKKRNSPHSKLLEFHPFRNLGVVLVVVPPAGSRIVNFRLSYREGPAFDPPWVFRCELPSLQPPASLPRRSEKRDKSPVGDIVERLGRKCCLSRRK